jgi:hypothetical protein
MLAAVEENGTRVPHYSRSAAAVSVSMNSRLESPAACPDLRDEDNLESLPQAGLTGLSVTVLAASFAPAASAC